MKAFKRIFSSCLAVCLLAGLICISVNAETEGDYTYTVSDGKATITEVSRSVSGDVEVPAALGGNTVVKIGNWAFSSCKDIKTVIIPEGVTAIGDWAFYNCSDLKTITLPAGITAIGGNAFLETLYHKTGSNWTDGVLYIGDYLIEVKESYSGAVTEKDGTKLNASLAFYGCSDVTEVTIPNSVTNICASAFRNSGVKKVNYGGSESEWAAVAIAENNGDLTSAAISYGAAPAPSVKVGDVNGDGNVTAKDVTVLARHIAKWTGYETVDATAADTNGDGNVTAKDVTVLARFIAKWTGYEALPKK